MGGDQIVTALAGEEAEREHGDELRELEGELFKQGLDEVETLPGASELVEALAGRGHEVVLASSAGAEEAESHIDKLGIRELISDYTTSADVEATKPESDLIKAALEKADKDAGDADAYLVGDSTWDIEAAKRAGIETVGLLCGGFSESELREAGAVEVYPSPVELREALDDSVLG